MCRRIAHVDSARHNLADRSFMQDIAGGPDSVVHSLVDLKAAYQKGDLSGICDDLPKRLTSQASDWADRCAAYSLAS